MSIANAQQFERHFYSKIPKKGDKKREVFVIAIEGQVPDKSFYSFPLCSKLNRSGIDTVDLNAWPKHLYLNGQEGVPATALFLVREAYYIRKERGRHSAIIVPDLPEDLLTLSPKYQKPLETAAKLLRHAINPSLVVYLDPPTGNMKRAEVPQYGSAGAHGYTAERSAYMKSLLLESYPNVLTIDTSKPKAEVVLQIYNRIIILLRR
jgi:hypothetical protein